MVNGQVKINCDCAIQLSHSAMINFFRDYTDKLLMVVAQNSPTLTCKISFVEAFGWVNMKVGEQNLQIFFL